MCASPGDGVGGGALRAKAQWSGQNIEKRKADHVRQEFPTKAWTFI